MTYIHIKCIPCEIQSLTIVAPFTAIRVIAEVVVAAVVVVVVVKALMWAGSVIDNLVEVLVIGV